MNKNFPTQNRFEWFYFAAGIFLVQGCMMEGNESDVKSIRFACIILPVEKLKSPTKRPGFYPDTIGVIFMKYYQFSSVSPLNERRLKLLVTAFWELLA